MRKHLRKIFIIAYFAVFMLATFFAWEKKLQAAKVDKFSGENVPTGEDKQLNVAMHGYCPQEQKQDDNSALFIGCNGFY